MQIETTAETPFVLIREARYPGSWARGESVDDAIRNLRANGGVDGNVYVMAVSRDAYVDSMLGELFAEKRSAIWNATLKGKRLTIAGMERPARA